MKIEDLSLVKRIIEGAIMSAEKPLSRKGIKELFDELECPDDALIDQALEDLQSANDARGFDLVKVASGYRYQVKQELSRWIGRLWKERTPRYSRALLETLSLIAYRQPITRGEIENVRGVAVSSQIIRTLLEREWIKVVGHRDVPGRPAIYATTRQFLDYFNLSSLDQLPPLAEIRELSDISRDFNIEMPPELLPQHDEETGDLDSPAETENESPDNSQQQLEGVDQALEASEATAEVQQIEDQVVDDLAVLEAWSSTDSSDTAEEPEENPAAMQASATPGARIDC